MKYRQTVCTIQRTRFVFIISVYDIYGINLCSLLESHVEIHTYYLWGKGAEYFDDKAGYTCSYHCALLRLINVYFEYICQYILGKGIMITFSIILY